LQSDDVFHACASARSRLQKLRKDPPASVISACLHGAHDVWVLPERRIQMFPQRSQYLSCMLRNCTGCLLPFIACVPPSRKKSPGACSLLNSAGSKIQSGFKRRPATGLDLFATTCSVFNFFVGGTPM
jgi:hypothetical protein